MEAKQLFTSRFSDKGFVFTFEAAIALLLVIGFIGTAVVYSMEKHSFVSLIESKELVTDLRRSFDENGFIVNILDDTELNSAEKMDSVCAMVKEVIPSNHDARIEMVQLDANKEECLAEKSFEECFESVLEFPSCGSELPEDKETVNEKFLILKKKSSGECIILDEAEFSASESENLTAFFEGEPWFFEGEEDLNIAFGTLISPEGEVECSQNIRVDVNAYIPSLGRDPADIMLVIDKSGSMSWDDVYMAVGTERDVFVDEENNQKQVYLGTSSYVYKFDLNEENGAISYLDHVLIDDARGIHVSGDYVLVADESTGLRVLDKSSLNILRTIGGMPNAEDVFVSGDYAYVVTSGSASSSQDQAMTGSMEDYLYVGYDSSYSWAAQSFTPSTSSVFRVALDLRRYNSGGDPGDLTVHIRSSLTGADLPNGTVTVSAGDISSGFYSWEYVDLPGSVSLVPGQKYYIVLTTSSTSTSRYYRWGSRSKSYELYSGGAAFKCDSSNNCTEMVKPPQSEFEDARFVTYGMEPGGLVVFDISDASPANWHIVGSIYDTGSGLIDDSEAVFVSGDYAYVADGTSGDSYDGLWVIDVSTKSNPVLSGFINLTDPSGVFVSGDFAFVADSFSGLRVIDVSTKSNPVLSTTVSGLGTVYDVFVFDSNAYVAAGTGWGATAYGLHTIDVNNPETAFLVRTFDSPYQHYRLAVDENFIYNAMYYGLTTVDKLKGPKMNKTRVSAKSFVNYEEWEQETDQLGVFSFNSSVYQDQTLIPATAANKSIVESEIDDLMAYGGTAIGDAMDSARDELLSVRGNPDALKFMVLLTDGQSNSGSDPITVANSVADDDVLVYTIGFGQDADTATLQQIASITGAEYYFAGDQNALTEVYTQIAIEIGELLATGSTEAFDSNVVLELPAGTQLVDLSSGEFVQGIDSNFVSFNIGFIDDDNPWSDYFIVTFDCALDSACEQSQLTFPGADSFFYYKNSLLESQEPIQWNDQKTINFKYRDLKLSILNGTITANNEIFLDLKALNAGMLSSNSTDIKLYLDDVTGALLETLEVSATDAGEAVYFYEEELGDEGLIVAVINQDKAISECPRDNIAKIRCTSGEELRYYLVRFWMWRE